MNSFIKKTKGAILLLLFLNTFLASGQVNDDNLDIRLQAQQEARYLRSMDKGVQEMDMGNFLVADRYFKEVFELASPLPAEICFYFGKNSYHLENYLQSIDWLNKYIELKGTGGQYFEESERYLQMAQRGYRVAQKEIKEVDESRGGTFQTDQVERVCQSGDKVVCPVCKGSGYLKSPGNLGGMIYQPCPYSDEHGQLTCEEYKQWLRGALMPKR
jgi:tetratricopeptide (TPR) repeat protein